MLFRIARYALTLASLTFASVLHAAPQPPAAPSDLIAMSSRPGDMAITLFWIDNASNESGFEIQRATEPDGTFTTIASGNDLILFESYNDLGLQENTTYTYRIRAFNDEGSSDFSGVASATTSYEMPNQVADLVGDVIEGDVHLSWIDMADNETFFEVERAEQGVSLEYEIIATLPPNSTNYVDTTPLAGPVYSYRVRPWRFDMFGGAPLSVELQTGLPIPSLNGVAAKAKSRRAIDLSWRSPSQRNARVEIQRFDTNLGFWTTIATERASERKFSDERLQPRTLYAYRLRIVTTSAVSNWSEVSATTR